MSTVTPDAPEMTTQAGLAEGLPPLAADATPEEKDLHWFRHVYQGDKVRQLTFRAVLMGGCIGMLMSIAGLYTTLKIGWSFGVAITACVISYVVWNGFRAVSGGRLGQMTILENNCMQSTASAAGYSTGATIATAFGALLLLNTTGAPVTEQAIAKAQQGIVQPTTPDAGGPGVGVGDPATTRAGAAGTFTQGATPPLPGPAEIKTIKVQPVWIVASFTFVTALMGVFLAIPMKRQMINVEQLPFPSGIAAATTLRSLYSKGSEAVKKAYSLIIALFCGALVGFLNTGEGGLKSVDAFFDWTQKGLAKIGWPFGIRLPEEVPFGSKWLGISETKRLQGFLFEPSVLLIAAGMIVGLKVSLSMLGSSALLYMFVAPKLIAMDQAHMAAHAGDTAYHLNIDLNGDGTQFRVNKWSLWGGTAVMVFSSLASVALQWKTIVRSFGLFKGAPAGATARGMDPELDRKMAAIEVPNAWLIAGFVPITIGLLAVQYLAFHINLWLGLVAVGMSFVLCMVACRATGETDTTPIGPMGKVMQLLFAVLSPRNITHNLMSASVAANSASSSADLLTDLKSGYLLGANPRKQFLAQFIGVFFGTLAIVPAWYLLVPDKAALEKFNPPATNMWKAVAEALTNGLETLPMSVRWAILIGALIGVGLPVLERLFPKARPYLPSAMGLGLAWVVSFSNSMSFAIGAVIAWAWSVTNKPTAERYTIPIASGLVAGESLMKAILAMTATAVGLYHDWKAAHP